MSRLLLGTICGLIYGALKGAFLNRFAIGFVTGAALGASMGQRIGFWLLLSLPDAITKAYAPILVLGAIGGLVIGIIVGKWGT
jgi:hypothetical protein